MVTWEIVHTKRSLKDFEKISGSPLKKKVRALLDIMLINPFQNPPPFEKLTGNLNGLYSRRINLHHRLVYQVIIDKKMVKVMSMWTHYE
jgi:Txe/YoeB family toxin of toxin-antitoxin system